MRGGRVHVVVLMRGLGSQKWEEEEEGRKAVADG